ncbi:hypothetical protein NKH18_31790 [Streptomyces sp. M10(2022)]
MLQAAEDLFYAEGIQSVGVERLLAVSGVGAPRSTGTSPARIPS